MQNRNRAIYRPVIVLGSMLLLLAGLSWAKDDKDESDIAKRIDAPANVLNEIMATPDKAIPDKIMRDAKCIAVLPSMIKIAVRFGGMEKAWPPAVQKIAGVLPRQSPLPAEAGGSNAAVRPSTWS